MSVAQYYTESGFAFVLFEGGRVAVYDLDHQDVQLPGDPDVGGRFLAIYDRTYLLGWGIGGFPLHAGMRALIVPEECMREVIEFLTDVELLPSRP